MVWGRPINCQILMHAWKRVWWINALRVNSETTSSTLKLPPPKQTYILRKDLRNGPRIKLGTDRLFMNLDAYIQMTPM